MKTSIRNWSFYVYFLPLPMNAEPINKALFWPNKAEILPGEHCLHLIASKFVPNSVGSLHRLHWQSKYQFFLILARLIVFPVLHGKYEMVISSPFLMVRNAVNLILLSLWIWNRVFEMQLKRNKPESEFSPRTQVKSN